MNEVLPDGAGGFQPCPEVLTPEETIRFLRLDVKGAENPLHTLKYYRERGRLKGTRIGKYLFYTKNSLMEFLEKMTG